MALLGISLQLRSWELSVAEFRYFLFQVVIVPDSWVPSNTNGFLWITGGSVTDGKPQVTDEDIEVSAALATGTGCITGTYALVLREISFLHKYLLFHIR